MTKPRTFAWCMGLAWVLGMATPTVFGQSSDQASFRPSGQVSFQPSGQVSNPVPAVLRFDAYGGFTDLNSPDLGLDQHGFHGQIGYHLRRSLVLGFDYTTASGDEVLTVGLLPAALQAQVLGAEAAYVRLGYLPANYVLRIPAHASTQTFALGPEYVNRHFRHVALFARPSLGALRERATPHPADAFATAISAELAPAGYKQDWTGFYGAGGGAEFGPARNVGVRAQFDAVYNHPFNDILANGRWTYRSSIGLAYHFGSPANFSRGGRF